MKINQLIITVVFSLNILISIVTINIPALIGWVCALIWATMWYAKDRENS